MLYKSIVFTNSKLKYVIVTGMAGNVRCDSNISVYLFNDRFFFIIKINYMLLKFNPKSNDIYIKNQYGNLLFNNQFRSNSLLFNKLNDLIYT